MPLKITLAHDAPGAIAALADDIRAEESADGFAGDPFAEVPLLIPDRSWDSWTRIHLAHHR